MKRLLLFNKGTKRQKAEGEITRREGEVRGRRKERRERYLDVSG
jgi:hypothetical protein